MKKSVVLKVSLSEIFEMLDKKSNVRWISARNKVILYLFYGYKESIKEILNFELHEVTTNYLILKYGKIIREFQGINFINQVKKYIEFCPFKIKSNSKFILGVRGNKYNADCFRKYLRNLHQELNMSGNRATLALQLCLLEDLRKNTIIKNFCIKKEKLMHNVINWVLSHLLKGFCRICN